MTRFIDIASLLALLQQRGAERFLCELADALHADFIRWNRPLTPAVGALPSNK